jgi:hypothetical protein
MPKAIKVAIRVVFVLALLGAFCWAVDPGRLIGYFNAKMAWAALPAGIVLLAGSIPLAARLGVLARRPAVPLPVAWKALVLSNGLNILIPGRLAELVKPVFLHEHAGLSFGNGFAALFLERATDVVILFGLALVAAGAAFVHLDWKFALVICLGLIGAVALIPLLEPYLLRLQKVIPLQSMREFYANTLAHMSLTIRQGRVLMGFTYGLVGWMFPLAASYVYFYFAAPEPLSFEAALTFFVVTTSSYLIPVLPAGMGAYEAAAVLVLQHYGLSVEEGLALGISLHACHIVLGMLLAMTVLAKERMGLGAFVGSVKEAVRRTGRASDNGTENKQ